MTFQELQELYKNCRRLGIATLGELAKFKKAHDCKTNKELLKVLREAY